MIVRAPAAWSLTLRHICSMVVPGAFYYTVMRCDAIDTLVEMDLTNRCRGKDLIYILAWRILMLLVKLFAWIVIDAWSLRRERQCREYAPIEPR